MNSSINFLIFSKQGPVVKLNLASKLRMEKANPYLHIKKEIERLQQKNGSYISTNQSVFNNTTKAENTISNCSSVQKTLGKSGTYLHSRNLSCARPSTTINFIERNKIIKPPSRLDKKSIAPKVQLNREGQRGLNRLKRRSLSADDINVKKDSAISFRTNSQDRMIENQFRNRNINSATNKICNEGRSRKENNMALHIKKSEPAIQKDKQQENNIAVHMKKSLPAIRIDRPQGKNMAVHMKKSELDIKKDRPQEKNTFVHVKKSELDIRKDRLQEKSTVVHMKKPEAEMRKSRPQESTHNARKSTQRRSLSAVHFRKIKTNDMNSFRTKSTDRLNVNSKEIDIKTPIKELPEFFKRRSVAVSTPESVKKNVITSSHSRQSSTALDLQTRLNSWLEKRGKPVGKCTVN